MTTATLQPVIDFYLQFAPFNQMTVDAVEFLASNSKLAFFNATEVILPAEQSPPQFLYIIKQGRVRGEQPEPAMDESAWELLTGECFPIGALLADRPPHTRIKAITDTFCFLLPRDKFLGLLQRSPVFADFCTRRITNLLDEALVRAQALATRQVGHDARLTTPLADIIKREPVTCRRHSTIRDALTAMQEARVSSIIISDETQQPVGILTLHDVLGRITLPGVDLGRPIMDVMSPDPISLPSSARASDAALLMAQHGFNHVLVLEQQQLRGIVSERDLFSLQRVGLADLSQRIGIAESIDNLKRLMPDRQQLVQQMQAQGVGVQQLTQLITAINDHITHRIIQLAESRFGRPAVKYAWLAFGSEGRAEQTLLTDQDNGIVFVPVAGESPATIRQALLPFASWINHALDDCGFPLCKGNVMASNPECCLNMQEWQSRYEQWISGGTPEHLLSASIYFDFRSLYGDSMLLSNMQQHIHALIKTTPRFLHLLTANALANLPPLGILRDFVVTDNDNAPHSIDLKKQGLLPFVDGARILALAHGITATNTAQRLLECAKAGVIPANEADAWQDAYHFIQLLRMRHHQDQMLLDKPADNHLDPDTLNDLERRILKEAFRQARKLQQRLELDYLR